LRNTVNRFNCHPLTVYEELNCYNPQSISDQDRKAISAIGKLSTNERAKFDYNALLERRWKVELANRDAFLRLYELFQACEPHEKTAVCAKLTQFKNHINRFETFKALKIDWSRFPFNAQIPQEAKQAAAQFSGEVTGWD